MSGHSKWSTIKHKKAKEDAKRGQVFTKLIREITVAAKEGGGDPAGNARLRVVLDKAKAANMPQDNITRAIKKGTGELEGVSYEAAIYEGYGPYGVAVIVETLSDNKQRTVADLRHIFSKMGGNLGETGTVGWMFEHKGVIKFNSKKMSQDDILEKLIEYPIDDIAVEQDLATVYCDIKDLDAVKKAITSLGFGVEDASFDWVAKNTVELENDEQEEKVYKFLETLEDLDDVQHVFVNVG
ncbi:MAG: Transcriptional regulator [candidate division TM6 bacterium GW2011_GWF2_28_16]|jgi:YebC/PmpR family DNA-binding regulatory protein|nr:MAG: Transcriptional regulator [candidate division TM6 bacterium GW2011_GWF2_28_16]